MCKKMTFTPKEYTPTTVLKIIHNSPRVVGSNNISISGVLDGQIPNYAYGLATAPGILIVVSIFWAILLCVFYQCIPKPPKLVTNILFVPIITVSTVGWFISIRGNNAVVGGVKTIIDNVNGAITEVENTLDDVKTFIDFLTNFDTMATQTSTACSATLGMTNESFPIANTSEFVTSVNETIGPIKDTLESVVGEVDTVIDLINTNLELFNTIYVAAIVTIIVWVSFFGLTTLLRSLTRWSVLDYLGKCETMIVFTVGMVVLVIMLVVAGVTAVLSTLGADFCVPGPKNTLERVVAEVADYSCSDEPLTYVCYYQTCEGQNPLEPNFNDISDMVGNISDTIQQVLSDVNQTINDNNITDVDCQGNITSLSNEIGKLSGLVDDALEITECATINPFYTGIVYDGICNGIVSGLGIIWITFCLGSVSMMAAMLIYCLYDFASPGSARVSPKT